MSTQTSAIDSEAIERTHERTWRLEQRHEAWVRVIHVNYSFDSPFKRTC